MKLFEPEPPSHARRDILSALAVWCTALGFGLGFGAPLWGWSGYAVLDVATQPAADILASLRQAPAAAFPDAPGALHALGLRAFLGASAAEFSAGLFAALCASLGAVLVYCAGVRLAGRPAALMAGLLVASNLLLLDASRRMHAAPLLFALSTASMVLAWTWFERRGLWRLALYALVTASLWQVAPFAAGLVAAQALWAVLLMAGWMLRCGFSLPGAVLKMFPFFLAASAGPLLCLLWTGGGPHYAASLPAAVLLMAQKLPQSAEELFSAYSAVAPYPKMGWLALLLAGLGTLWGAACGQARQTVFILLWLGAGLAGSALHEPGTYPGINVLAPLALLAGLGVDLIRRIAGDFFSHGRRSATAQILAAALCLLAVSWQSLQAMSLHLRRDADRVRDVCFDMAFYRRDIAHAAVREGSLALLPQGARSAWNRLVPGMFSDPGTDFSRAYRRIYLLSGPDAQSKASAQTGVEPFREYGRVKLAVAGLANVSPLVVRPGTDGVYALDRDFSGLEVYREAHGAQNMVFSEGAARAAFADRPAHLEYAFATPQDHTLESFAVSVKAFWGAVVSPSGDSVLRLSFSRDGQTWKELGAYSLSSVASQEGGGRENGLEAARSVQIAGEDLGERFFVRVEFLPGAGHGRIALRQIGFSARLSGLPSSADALAALEARHVAANAGARLWKPGSEPQMPCLALFGRGHDPEHGLEHGPEQADVPWHSQAEEAAFLARYPNARMVWQAVGEDGRRAFAAYDPGLAAPASLFTPGSQVRLNAVAGPVSAVAARGIMRSPTFACARGQGLSLGMDSPLPVWGNAFAGGEFQALAEPVFTEAARPLAQLAAEGNLKRHGQWPCLTCGGPLPCSATWSIRSAAPIAQATLVLYPRWLADRSRRNAVTMSYSTDQGRTWVALGSFKGMASGFWEGADVAHVVRARLETPSRELLVRAGFSGDGAQLWSSPERPMRILVHAVGERPAFPGPGGQECALEGASGNNFTYQLLDAKSAAPVSGLDALLR